ncbi:alpha/beta fold hydrolase [Solimonas soli]|uniref:alpha/beta fold hydrolase n=1 Tax=Solimonas soli TaxID=413479 RepID=UPI00048215E3|nr:alpha/beta hydrolase [Solimonas soli]
MNAPAENTPSKPVPEGKYAQLPNGYRIHYLDEGSGPVVVFLHGSGSGACGYSNFKGNYPALVRAGYRVILPDLIGYGYSDKPADVEYPLSFFIDCVKQTLDRIGVSRYTLVGNSLGGAIALDYALQHAQNVEKLVLMAPGGLEDQPDYFKMPAMAFMKEVFMSPQPVTKERLRYFMENALVHDKSVVDDELVDERHALMLMQNPQVVKTMQVPNLTARLPEIRCPALAFWGINEKMMPETGILKLARGMPNLRLVTVPNCGHWVMVEHRDFFNRALIDFLKNG